MNRNILHVVEETRFYQFNVNELLNFDFALLVTEKMLIITITGFFLIFHHLFQ